MKILNNLDLNSNKIINISNATASTDAVALGQLNVRIPSEPNGRIPYSDGTNYTSNSSFSFVNDNYTKLNIDYYGNPRSLKVGYSGGNYGGFSYGINYTNTAGWHTYAVNDIVTRIDAYDGLKIFAAPAGTVNTNISWTQVADIQRNGSIFYNTLNMTGSRIFNLGLAIAGSDAMSRDASDARYLNISSNAVSATTATKLTTARSINGTLFDGTADIKNTEWIHSPRDFPNGTLITTSIDYSQTQGDPWVLEIRGNSYNSAIPFEIQVQGYIYTSTIINYGGYSVGTNITDMVALNVGGQLCFWFPNQAYWHGYNVRVYTAYANQNVNKIISVTNVVKPTGTREVALSSSIKQVLREDNYINYAMTKTGNPDNTDNWWNARVIRNTNTSNYTDGMYIGYGNSNSGSTRIYGGGATGGGIVVIGSGVNDIKYNAVNTFFHTGNYDQINVSNLVTGTLSDARLSSNIPTKGSSNTWSAVNIFSNNIILNDPVNPKTNMAYSRYISFTDNASSEIGFIGYSSSSNNDFHIYNNVGSTRFFNAANGERFRIDGSLITAYSNLDLTSNKIIGLANGTASNDAVNKSQLDSLSAVYQPLENQRLSTTHSPSFVKLTLAAGSQTKHADARVTFNDVFHYNNVSSSVTGAFVIETPIVINDMMDITIQGYDYSWKGNWTLSLGAYTYTLPSIPWANFKGDITGIAPFASVTLAYNTSNNKYVIILGTVSTTWYYPTIAITKVISSFAGTNRDNYIGGWSGSFVTSLAAYGGLNAVNLQKCFMNYGTGVYQGTPARLLGVGTDGTVIETNPISSNISGTTNYVPKFTGANTIGNSSIINVNGFIGVNTTTPVTPLSVRGNGDQHPNLSSPTGSLTVSNSDTSYGLQIGNRFSGSSWLQSGSLQGSANVYSMELNPLGGNVLVGGTNTGGTLTVTGDIKTVRDNDFLNSYQSSANSSQYQTWYTAGNVRRGFFGYSSSGDNTLYLVNETQGNINITNGTGKIGLGTANPYSKVHIDGDLTLSSVSSGSGRYIILPDNSTGTSQFIIQAGAGSSGFGGALNLYGHSHATKPGWIVAGISVNSGTGGSATEGRFAVASEATGGGNELFTVLRSGNVGVGVTPTEKLHINGNAKATKFIGSNVSDMIKDSSNQKILGSDGSSIYLYTGTTDMVIGNQSGTGYITISPSGNFNTTSTITLSSAATNTTSTNVLVLNGSNVIEKMDSKLIKTSKSSSGSYANNGGTITLNAESFSQRNFKVIITVGASGTFSTTVTMTNVVDGGIYTIRFIRNPATHTILWDSAVFKYGDESNIPTTNVSYGHIFSFICENSTLYLTSAY